MAYIGRQPTVGNFRICDAISVVNGQAAYTMQVGGVNVIPESHNNMIVSLNGVIQKPGSSFTVSSSTITFSSNLSTGDVIDFIQILGGVANIGTPSDGTVTTAKIGDDAVTTAKITNDAVTKDKLLSHNYPAFYARLDGSQTVTDNAVTKVNLNEEYFDTDNCFDHTTNYRFTPTVAGKYYFYGQIWMDSGVTANNLQQANIYIYKNGTSLCASRLDARNTYTGRFNTKTTSFITSANGTSDYFELYGQVNNTSGTPAFYSTSSNIHGYTYFGAYRIGD